MQTSSVVQHQLGTPSSSNPRVISVGRLFIEAGKRDLFQREFDSVIQILKDFARPHLVQGGWRADKEADSKEEFVLVVGWDSVERHFKFADSPDFAKYAGIRECVADQEIKHYKRFL